MHENISEQQARAILAENLRRFRAARGISQEALAALAGVHRTFVGQIEKELKNVSLETLVKLANALEVKVFELLMP
jgi:transcriptional regulator with XRE-family HTH domain